MDDYTFQFKINGLNHNCFFEKDKQEIESERARKRRFLEDRMREETRKARNSVFDPNHMVFNIRDTVQQALFDPNHMVFNIRKPGK